MQAPPAVLSKRHLYVLPAAMLVALGGLNPIGDNSLLWHIRAGTMQLDLGEVIRTDPFSFTQLGQPWRTQSWLAELAYGWLERSSGGLGWIAPMIATAGLLMLIFTGIAIYQRTGRVIPMAIGLTVTALGFLYFAVGRPVLISFVLLPVLLVVLGNSQRLAWVLVPLLWFWATVHGSWVIAVAIIGLEILKRRQVRLLIAGTVATLATVLTPHGIEGWRFAFDLSTSREALAYLSEWQPPDFTQPVLWPFLLVIVGVLVAATRGKLTLTDLVMVVPLLLLGLMQERTVVVALLVLVPYAASAFDSSEAAPPNDRPALNWLIVGAVVVAMIAAFAVTPTRLSRRFPVDLVTQLESDLVFVGVRVGGYLIYDQGPDRLVYIDDRAELYGADGFEEFTKASDGVGYQEVFERWGFTEAVVKDDWPLRLDLISDGWTEVAEEGQYRLMRAP